jgi:hypothetical protein
MTSLRPVRSAVATTRSALSTLSARGFSTNTCAPASIAAMAYDACVSGSVLIDTTSGFDSASARA